jgi:hypothetical protein
MWADWKEAPDRHFYVKELAQLKDGRYVVPMRWITFQKAEHVEVLHIMHDQTGNFLVKDPELVRIPVGELRYNYLDLQVQLGSIRFFSTHAIDKPPWSWLNLCSSDPSPSPAFEMPHPVRKVANNRPVFILRIMPWADDVSGNRSKQYNAHMNIYIANINLPHRKLAQEYFVRFCSTSPHASSSEQFDGLAEDLYVSFSNRLC